MPTVRRNEPISTWEDGDFVQGFALLNRKERRQDKNGREYLDLELADARGSVSAKVWPDSPALGSRFDEKDFVEFKGTARTYRGRLQVTIDHCRTATAKDRENGFDESLLVPTTPEDIDDLWNRLNALLPEALERAELRELVARTLARWGDALREHPAAKSIHHAYRGGLLEHVVAMLELGVKVCEQYGDVDRDLVLVGILFHDLGKIHELGAMPANDYTLEGQLVGHVVLGHRMLGDLIAGIDDFPEILRLQLEHLVLSHQGRLEYGSPVEPSTVEAVVLSFVDDLDSRLNQLRGVRRDTGGGLQYVRVLGRSVYLTPLDEA